MRSRCAAREGSSASWLTSADYQLRQAHGRRGRAGPAAAKPVRRPSVSLDMGASAIAWEGRSAWRRIPPRMAFAGVGERKGMAADGSKATSTPVVAAGAAAADPDVALMLRVRAGDEGAFRELFEKFAPRVLQLVRRYLGKEAQAEEVT